MFDVCPNPNPNGLPPWGGTVRQFGDPCAWTNPEGYANVSLNAGAQLLGSIDLFFNVGLGKWFIQAAVIDLFLVSQALWNSELVSGPADPNGLVLPRAAIGGGCSLNPASITLVRV